MIDICLAELKIRIKHRYPLIEQMCENYFASFSCPDIIVSVTEEEIKAEGKGSLPYLETLAIYRKISERILEYDGFLMHGAVLEIDGTGVAFLAKSGTGKTTHLRLWKRLFGEKVTVVNGDKPLLRLIDGKVYAFGTPWAGKEGYQTNTSVPLTKICFLNRGETNSCTKAESKGLFPLLYHQIYKPKNKRLLSKTLDLTEQMMKQWEFYTIDCNMEPDAAKTAYQTLFYSGGM